MKDVVQLKNFGLSNQFKNKYVMTLGVSRLRTISCPYTVVGEVRPKKEGTEIRDWESTPGSRNLYSPKSAI